MHKYFKCLAMQIKWFYSQCIVHIVHYMTNQPTNQENHQIQSWTKIANWNMCWPSRMMIIYIFRFAFVSFSTFFDGKSFLVSWQRWKEFHQIFPFFTLSTPIELAYFRLFSNGKKDFRFEDDDCVRISQIQSSLLASNVFFDEWQSIHLIPSNNSIIYAKKLIGWAGNFYFSVGKHSLVLKSYIICSTNN